MHKVILLGAFLLTEAHVTTSRLEASPCPADIGQYGYHDGRGGSFGETLMALRMNRPQCICKLNTRWIKEWYYSSQPGMQHHGPEAERLANGKRDFEAWLKQCKR